MGRGPAQSFSSLEQRLASLSIDEENSNSSDESDIDEQQDSSLSTSVNNSANIVESYNLNSNGNAINTTNRYSLISTNTSTPTPATPVLSSTPHTHIIHSTPFTLTPTPNPHYNTPSIQSELSNTPTNDPSISPLLISTNSGSTTIGSSLFRAAHHLQPHTPLLSALQNLVPAAGQVTHESLNVSSLQLAKTKERSIFTAPPPNTAQPDNQQQQHNSPKLSASAPSFVPNFNLNAKEVSNPILANNSSMPVSPLLAPLLAKAKENHEVEEAQEELEHKASESSAVSAPVPIPGNNTAAVVTVSPHHEAISKDDLRVDTVIANQSNKSTAKPNSPSKTKPSPNKHRHLASFTIKKQTDQLRTMARLTNFNEVLNITTEKSYIILDLDETVYLNKYQPCEMMKEKGLLLYQHTLANHQAYKHLNFATKTKLTRTLQIALQSKRPVEQDTVQTIHALQQRGICVFALTARYSHMAPITKKELASLGLDLSITSPFPKDAVLRDQETEASYDGGVIFTNACEKGPVLDRFLHNLFANARLNNSKSSVARSLFGNAATGPNANNTPPASTTGNEVHSKTTASLATPPVSATRLSTPPAAAAAAAQASSSTARFAPPALNGQKKKKKTKSSKNYDSDGSDSCSGPESEDEREFTGSAGLEIPDKIIFLDDRLQNCVSVLNGLSVADRLRVPVYTYHYQPPCHVENEIDPKNPPSPTEMAALAEFQIHHFINTSQLLDDKQARLVKAQLSGELTIAFNPSNSGTLSRPSSRAGHVQTAAAFTSLPNNPTPATPNAVVVPVAASDVASVTTPNPANDNKSSIPNTPQQHSNGVSTQHHNSLHSIPLFELGGPAVNHHSHSSAQPIPIPKNSSRYNANATRQPRQQKYSPREYHQSPNQKHSAALKANLTKAILSSAS